MHIHEQLADIQTQLTYLTRIIEGRPRQPIDNGLRVKLESAIKNMSKGFASSQSLGFAIGMPPTKQSSHAVGRVMDAMGYKRHVTAKFRGFIIP